MDSQKIRIFLLIALFFIGFTLYGTWQQEHPPQSSVATAVASSEQSSEVPRRTHTAALSAPQPGMQTIRTSSQSPAQPILVETDVLRVNINLNGGDITLAELKKYPEIEGIPDKGVQLLSQTDKRNYIAQSYLIADENEISGPDDYSGSRGHYQTQSKKYEMGEQDTLTVDLIWQGNPQLKFIKRFHFRKGEYLVDVSYLIQNQTQENWNGNVFYQLRRELGKSEEKSGFLSVQMFEGGAYYTPEKPFNKISFDKMKSNPLNEEVQGGWVAMLEHYFLSTWIPQPDKMHHFYTKVDGNNIYKIGSTNEVTVPAQTEREIKTQIYMGPEKTDVLKEISPGLNLTVDYGILWPISQFLFWVLKGIHKYVQNWGVAIILVTVLIKLAFYKLSAASYRSMANMRRIQPKLQALKERHGDDKQAFSQAMMALYKKEKINPLGGCLPILLQIPVFIALYYMLLESVELRQAPFFFWITDLSSRDPFYVLPLLMGATMFIQQKLSPAPPDPMQAKMMMLMPIVFTFLFMSFPSGLVLYWTVNNLLSILQQWYITHRLEKEGLKRA